MRRRNPTHSSRVTSAELGKRWADAETLAIWLKMANLWKSTIPELRLYQTFCTPAPDQVLRMIDQACVHVAVYRGGKDSGSVS